MPIAADRKAKPVKTIIYGAEDKQKGTASQRWWLLPKDKIHEGVWPVTDTIIKSMAQRSRMNLFFASLYNDSAIGSNNVYYNRSVIDGASAISTGLTLNAMQNCIDTACAIIAKNKPKPQALTDGSKDYETKVKGKELTKYLDGVFDETKIHTKTQLAFKDGCIYGTGYIKLFIDGDKIKCERLFVEEVLVDDLEGMHETPTQKTQRKFIARDVLIAQFPEYESYIRGCEEIVAGSKYLSTADLLDVRESWHLRSGKKAKDGLHTICIQNCTLFVEEYKKDFYPIIPWRWEYQPIGFYGRGICHETWKLQRDLDITLQTIQRSQRLVSGPIVAVESGSNISEDHLTSNKLGKIVEYSVTPPQFLTPPAVNAELYNWVQFLRDQIFEVAGVSQAAATGQKPKEVKSAVAIREVNDMTAGRFEIIGQRWEDFHLDIARVILDLSADLYDKKPDLSVMTTEKGSAKRINFKDVCADLDEFKLQLFPVSGLPNTPAGRLDQLMDWAEAGYLAREQVMDIADFPDLEDTTSLETASLHLTQQILSNIKLKGKEGYIPPGPYLSLPEAYRMSSLEIDRAKLQNVKEDHIEQLMKWNDAVNELMMQAKAQQMMTPPAQQNAGTASQQGSSLVGAQMAGQQPMPGEAQPQMPPPQMPTGQ